MLFVLNSVAKVIKIPDAFVSGFRFQVSDFNLNYCTFENYLYIAIA
jgi:hypothetical protein